MRSNIKLGLFRLLPVTLLALLDNVIAKLTGNALFPAPPVTLAALGTLRDQLKAAIEAATNGSVAARKYRDGLVLEVRDALRATADYVRAQCDGDAAKLATSGFELAKRPEPINQVQVPKNVTARATDTSGEVLLRWGHASGTRIFRVEQASGDPALGSVTWSTVALISRQRFVVRNLTSYKENWFRITAIGVDSEGLPSDVVMGRAA